MQIFEAVKIWLEYHKTNSREKTLRTYRTILSKSQLDWVSILEPAGLSVLGVWVII